MDPVQISSSITVHQTLRHFHNCATHDNIGYMIMVYEKREFHGYTDRNSGKTFSDLEFRECKFVGCKISVTPAPKHRSKIRNVKFIHCEQLGCTLYSAIVEDVLIDGFKTNGLIQSWGAVFQHLVIRGKIGRIMISQWVPSLRNKPNAQKAFDEANAVYYQNVDWAMDIREAQFEEAELRGVPAKLMIRDPETQFVLTREKALEGKWKNVDLSGTYWATGIELFLNRGEQDVVFVAPKRHPRFRPLLAGLWALRDAGIFEDG